jgi:serine/threonine-protein kinase RsbW
MTKDSQSYFPISVSIKNELPLICSVQAAAKSYAELLGFENNECFHIELLLEETLSNIIKFDFMPGQKEDIVISMEPTTLGMAITIHSMSIPLDVEKIRSFEKADNTNIINQNASGLGTLLITKFADQITYANKGKAGQFIYFEKYLPHKPAVNSNIIDKTQCELPSKTEFTFYMRRLKPEEASFVSQLAYYAYHLTYIYDKIYYPEFVRKLNEQGEMISVVAVNNENEDIIGHVAAIQHDLTGMPEIAVAFVNPQYRGAGCLHQGSEFLINLLTEKGEDGIIAHAVTTHPYSQKAASKLNLKESAVYVSRLTPLAMNEISGKNLVRESLLLMYLSLKPKQIKDIYPPEHHKEMVSKIFENIGQPVNIITDNIRNKPEKEQSEIKVFSDSYCCSHICIKKYGDDSKTVVENALKSICVSRIETIYLYLPLEIPETSFYCAEFEALQFFFGGIVQDRNNKDYLMLQYLNNLVYPYNTIETFSDFAKELVLYIKDQDPNQKI